MFVNVASAFVTEKRTHACSSVFPDSELEMEEFVSENVESATIVKRVAMELSDVEAQEKSMFSIETCSETVNKAVAAPISIFENDVTNRFAGESVDVRDSWERETGPPSSAEVESEISEGGESVRWISASIRDVQGRSDVPQWMELRSTESEEAR